MRNRADGSLDEVDAHARLHLHRRRRQHGLAPKEIIRDQRGYICTGRDVTDLMPEAWPLERDPYLLETSVPGIFAAGDVRHGSIKRVAAGVGEGSIAIAFVHAHLADLAARSESAALRGFLEVVVDEPAGALADVGRDGREDRAQVAGVRLVVEVAGRGDLLSVVYEVIAGSRR